MQWMGEPIYVPANSADDGGGFGLVVLLGCGLEDADQISQIFPPLVRDCQFLNIPLAEPGLPQDKPGETTGGEGKQSHFKRLLVISSVRSSKDFDL